MSQAISDSQLDITVLGAGAWGSTLAQLAIASGHRVRLWSRRSPICMESALDGTEIIISAVSMKGVRPLIEQVQAIGVTPSTLFVSATKGLDPTFAPSDFPRLASQLWQAGFPEQAVVVLSGPNLSEEIQQGLPAATVVASQNSGAAETVQRVLSSPQFRVYTNPDVLGVELGGTLKNVMAIAAGACDGLQLGTNAKAALLTRGLAEIIRIGTYWGAKPETFYGLSGLGDLLATCNSALSRNYQVGYGLAQGKTLEEVLAQLEGTAEGVNTTQVLVNLAQQRQVSVPISEQVARLLSGQITPRAAVEALMLRDYKPEIHQSTP